MINYASSGVDINAGNRLVEKLKENLPNIGGFAGLFPLGDQYLVAGTDGVGTKLKLAIEERRFDTIGIDLVAMCVNDILTTGADPLFFLDYYATSKLDVEQAEQVIAGIAKGCQEAGMALLGGETAEMPGFYRPGDFDICGFAVGIVPKSSLIDGSTIEAGDVIIGIPSNGVHSNGFSLVHKILEIDSNPPSDLLAPTKIYSQETNQLRGRAKGMAHITGGGLTENVPRIIPEGLGAEIDTSLWNVPEIFNWIETTGNVDRDEMFRVFNMGIGLTAILSPHEVREGEKIIGHISEGKGVTFL